MQNVLFFAALALTIALLGCEKAKEKTTAKEDAKPAAPRMSESSHEANGHAAEVKTPASGEQGGHGGPVIELGTTKIGAFEARASRDKVEFKPGGDPAIDVWIDGGVGKGVTAVRFWIGTQDAKGSMKAKADIEDGKWHTHAEVPDPLPVGSMLWVEIEASNAPKQVGGFALKN